MPPNHRGRRPQAKGISTRPPTASQVQIRSASPVEGEGFAIDPNLRIPSESERNPWLYDQGPEAWEWDAGNDSSIPSDDSHRDEKIKWRFDHDHEHKWPYRVKKWQRTLDELISTADTVERLVIEPDEVWDGVGRRNKSRSRSPSLGRTGEKKRRRMAAEWRQKSEASRLNWSSNTSDTATHTVSEHLQRWIEKLRERQNYKHLSKTCALQFFALPLEDKVSQVEILAREVESLRMR